MGTVAILPRQKTLKVVFLTRRQGEGGLPLEQRGDSDREVDKEGRAALLPFASFCLAEKRELDWEGQKLH